jgi:EAL domain-containing protein (putative c-di-GMP-specific phosphodiesterase class I)
VLCRWEKKNGQVVLPGSFIDYAEVTGLAIPMTLSLMQQVRNDLADICRDMPDIKVSINLFEGHFRDSSIVEDVQAIFADSPISFRQLVFEITERRPLESPRPEEEQHGLTGLDYEERALSLPAKEILRLHDNVAIGQSSRS